MSLHKFLDKDSELKQNYYDIFKTYEQEGIIQEVLNEEDKVLPYAPYYLPHRPIIKQNKLSTKIRPVFDASCKSFNGYSLNDLLEVGPILHPLIIGILLRWRRWPVSLSADVKQAFLQIVLNIQCRDFCRFLLMENDIIRIMRFTRLPFGVSCAPFLLNAVIKYHLNSYESSFTIKELLKNVYVDDLLSGADSIEEATTLYNEANLILKAAGLPLTKWTSNNNLLNSLMNMENGEKTSYILGVKFDLNTD